MTILVVDSDKKILKKTKEYISSIYHEITINYGHRLYSYSKYK